MVKWWQRRCNEILGRRQVEDGLFGQNARNDTLALQRKLCLCTARCPGYPLRLLEERTCTKYWKSCPIAFDFEYDSVNYARKNGVSITKDLATDMAIEFLHRVKDAGHVPVIYTNRDYLRNYFDTEDPATYFRPDFFALSRIFLRTYCVLGPSSPSTDTTAYRQYFIIDNCPELNLSRILPRKS